MHANDDTDTLRPPMTPIDPDCPTDDQILAFADGLCPHDEAALIAAHIDTCEVCVALLAEAGRGLAHERLGEARDTYLGQTSDTLLAGQGAQVGRYRLLEVIGRGAVGVVFLAHDPDLDRRVAVKLVRFGDGLGRHSPEFARRAILEAKAMARLSHPNVVTVHDVGTFEGGVYLAMELVEGTTLSAWLLAAPRSWQTIVSVFAQAGEGLAAAHEVGLVHRDFKPDNVLIAENEAGDLRVLVTDFGLARADVVSADSHPENGTAPVSLTHTAVGTVIGTPAYMAPEQLRGDPIDQRADIFAFGVSLFEALAGVRPFGGGTVSELAANYRTEGSLKPLVGRCPGRIVRAIQKAIALDPAARPHSLLAIIAELRHNSRRRWWVFAFLLVAFGAVFGWLGSNRGNEALDTCIATASGRADSVFGEQRRKAIGASLGVVMGRDLGRRVESQLEHYLETWVDVRSRACGDVWVRGEQSEATLELRVHCLERRLAEFDALVQLIETGGNEVTRQAPAAVAGLPSALECERTEGLAEREKVPTEPWSRTLSKAADEISARAIAAELAGQWGAGAEYARIAAMLAESSKDNRTIAESLTVLARLEMLAGRTAASKQTFDRAIPTAFLAGDERGAAQGLIGRAYLLIVMSDAHEEAHRWLDLAHALIERPGGDSELEMKLRTVRAEIYARRLSNEKAIAELQIVENLQARTRGLDDPALVRTLDLLGVAEQQAERYADALDTFDRGLNLALDTLGATHPDTQNLTGNLAYCLTKVGRYRDADHTLQRLYPYMVQTFGAGHWNPAIVRQMWALAITGLGVYGEALAWHEHSIGILRAAFSDSPGQLAYSLVAFAETALAAEDFALAETQLAEARRLTEPTPPTTTRYSPR